MGAMLILVGVFLLGMAVYTGTHETYAPVNDRAIGPHPSIPAWFHGFLPSAYSSCGSVLEPHEPRSIYELFPITERGVPIPLVGSCTAARHTATLSTGLLIGFGGTLLCLAAGCELRARWRRPERSVGPPTVAGA